MAKRYTPEIGDTVVNFLFDNLTADRLAVFNIGLAEVVSILVRKRNAGIITAAAFSQTIADFSSEIIDQNDPRKVEISTPMVTAALPFIVQHSINATDAILLRSALDLALNLRFNGDDLVLVAADQRLLRAAIAEGLTVFNPETQTIADLSLLLA